MAADRLVADLLEVLPPGAALVVTADHGQVDVGDRGAARPPTCSTSSSSSRARAGSGGCTPGPVPAADLLDVAADALRRRGVGRAGGTGRDEGWFGRASSPEAASRLGDVALVARDPVAFDDPADSGPFRLVGRHGSLTPAEMRVPLLAAGAS